MPKFELNPAYIPVADQPKARDGLSQGIEDGDRFQTLLGVTGSGKTATMAFTIEQVQRPALVIAHNKTLAAQLCNEFRELFPKNAVEYFVSYYDYYQPEAYVPAQDLYIEKDSSINEEIDRLRHAATAALFARRDVIVVAVGVVHLRPRLAREVRRPGPDPQAGRVRRPRRGPAQARRHAVQRATTRRWPAATFRVRGETLEVFPAYAESAYRAVLLRRRDRAGPALRPAHRRGARRARARGHLAGHPLRHRPGDDRARRGGDPRRARGALHQELEAEGKLLESHRLRQRTQFDMEMLRELGFCNGIENYSRILDGREPGERPYCLLDFFPEDFVCFIDESHQTVPQIGGMYEGDRSRKQTLIDYGFRLPSALDNRPQTFDEFLAANAADRLRLGHAGRRSSAATPRGSSSRSCGPTGHRRPGGRGARDQEPDRRPDERDPHAGRGGRAHAGHDPDEEDGRGPDRLPDGVRLPRPLPALGDRHARADPDHPRAAARRVRRARRRQPPARGARPARGLARRDHRRRQGGLPPRRDLADPDDRPRRAQHQAAG